MAVRDRMVELENQLAELAEDIALAKNIKHTIEVVVDRLVMRPGIAGRLADSLEVAFKYGTEVAKVEGFVGNYKVTVRRKPRYVNEELCVGCVKCVEACIYKEAKFADEFNEGLGKRKPVYIPFPQATPQVVLIDPEVCLNFKRGVLTDKCKKTCVEACGEKKAIVSFENEKAAEEILSRLGIM
jgi:heterodisulfide reductase subunit A-like polyferredoxin